MTSDPDTIQQSSQTREELVAWYPRARFISELNGSFIDIHRVYITIGTLIDLSNHVIIIEDTRISLSVVILDSTINFLIIYKEVNGGQVYGSTVLVISMVSGGYINYSTMKGIVLGGSVNYSII